MIIIIIIIVITATTFSFIDLVFLTQANQVMKSRIYARNCHHQIVYVKAKGSSSNFVSNINRI